MKHWRHQLLEHSPISMLIVIGIASVVANTGWRVVMNNFAVDTVGMTGESIGMLQSIREIPGLLAFTVMFLLMAISEQRAAILSLGTLGVGVAITGYLPTVYGFYFTTVVMSTGFHYLEAVNRSLSTQALDTATFGESMGQIRAASSFFGMVTFAGIIVAIQLFDVSGQAIFVACGVLCTVFAMYLLSFNRSDKEAVKQKNRLIFRWEYATFYFLTFLGGARRQIFVVFAGLLMVQKFEYTITMMAILFMFSSLIATVTLPIIGRLIDKIGDKNALMIEYAALVAVFVAYALVDNYYIAGALYIMDSVIFNFNIALATYFKRTIRPDEISATSSLSFTINHIAAVFLPALLGIMWMASYKVVFMIGAVIAFASFFVARLIDRKKEGQYASEMVK